MCIRDRYMGIANLETRSLIRNWLFHALVNACQLDWKASSTQALNWFEKQITCSEFCHWSEHAQGIEKQRHQIIERDRERERERDKDISFSPGNRQTVSGSTVISALWLTSNQQISFTKMLERQ
eukprot:TRINITY_DN1543_c0_g1_i2.p2 TRINITY_DN1543_c0_g1~~TRINITY_DN1543_c0_g1_i2.p2  ORF type:complete len:124 (-),score=7.20 TRINITY_DN1543_c0_g1_i2:306-677(-)